MTPDMLREAIAPLGMPRFRAAQIFDWLHQKGAARFDEMTNLSKAQRTALAERFWIAPCEIAKKQISAPDGTVKYLFRLHDGETVEGVVMRYRYGNSMCVSTQVGCRMGCRFCASGQHGLVRNLLPGEILGQLASARRDLGESISRVVLMGMGEPLENYDNVLRFLRLVSHPEGFNIGQRRLSLSTCGLTPQIKRLQGEGLGLTLSVSLHAPNDKIRNALMPVNRAYPMQTLLRVCADYASATSRRISFEYALFDGCNDSDACAKELGARLGKLLCHVNLIPANPVEALGFRRSKPERIKAFAQLLGQQGISVTVRRSLGGEIGAACGQLRQSNR
jgi:23S rRNA (adenine2503-C2)-methyltransferase